VKAAEENMTNDSHSFSAFVEKWDHEMRSKKAHKKEMRVCVRIEKDTDKDEKLRKKVENIRESFLASFDIVSHIFSHFMSCVCKKDVTRFPSHISLDSRLYVGCNIVA
jgi:hypothetical protein